MGVSNNALQLRKDNQTQSAVGFIGTGGIVIQSTGTSMTIDGSSISGGTQSLSFNSSQRRTSLSQGGGSFTINGGSNIDVSLSANGAYTISSSGGSTQELYRQGAFIGLTGTQTGVEDRYVSSASKSGNNITLNRTDGLGGVTFNIADGDSDPNNELQSFTHNTSTQTTTLSRSGGSFRLVGGTNTSVSLSSGGVYTINSSGGSSPWTISGSNIYRNSGVTIGSTQTTNNIFRVHLVSRFYDDVGLWTSTGQNAGGLFATSNSLEFSATNNALIEGSGVRLRAPAAAGIERSDERRVGRGWS